MGNTCECGKCLATVDCGEGTTVLALALEIAMACDSAAQDRYLAIYGVAWTSNPSVTLNGKSIAATTRMGTVR